MRWLVASLIASLILVAAVMVPVAWSCGGYGDLSAHLVARKLAATESDESAGKLADQLRALGPEGLQALLDVRDGVAAEENPVQQQAAAARSVPPKLSERLSRLDSYVDRVAGQRGASISRLYWYTDMSKATEVAKASKKPILSLRMLGNLTEECSCANSRFFRTSLYSNAEVSKYLRENYVLHWQSVRPVPKVTIDFGDGRKLVRTVTGNSIHFVLDNDGRVIDGLPGLYGPQAFARWLADTKSFVDTLAPLSPQNQDALLVDYHGRHAKRLHTMWTNDVQRVAPDLAAKLIAEQKAHETAGPKESERRPTAREAAKVAIGKSAIEAVLVDAVTVPAGELEAATDDEMWKLIAALRAEDAKLDATSIAIIRSENPPTAKEAARMAFSKARVEDPIVRMVRQFEASIALDTVKNEYLLHRQIHEWLASSAERPTVDALNERVYAELFLTPSSDPWLGLAPADTYTALENGGTVAEKQGEKQ
jgi:hypothetical protein